MPGLSARWALSNSEAGWITAVFYAAYLVAVPVLVTLTDRLDPKRAYLTGVGLTVLGHLLFAAFADGFWTALAARALTGVGWAGTYMTGLKLVADRVDAGMMSRAAAGHAASIGVSGALSFAAADLLAALGGWQAAFAAASLCAGGAWLLVAAAVPGRASPQESAGRAALFDFRPVLRNRSAMAYAIAYAVHTLEMNAVRGWGVAFLGFVAAGTGGAGAVLSPAVVLTVLGLLGTVASVLGNEAAIRAGRRRLIGLAMLASAVCAVLLGVVGPGSYALAAALLLIYGPLIWLDSSSLTAGTAGSAEPSRRGATLAVHSMLGYSGGFLGPLMIGWVLDLHGGMSGAAWATAFVLLAALSVAALVVFLLMRPKALAGDVDCSS